MLILIFLHISESPMYVFKLKLIFYFLQYIYIYICKFSERYRICLSFHPIVLRASQRENEQDLTQRVTRAISRCFAFPYNIRRVLVDEITSTGMVSTLVVIRNAICGVFAAQKITAASSNEPCARDLGCAR